MNTAIWMLRYRIGAADRERYLHWFHTVHIPEKLARPGYNWAAHYQSDSPDEAGRHAYVGMFGGTSTRVFLDPSPAQLKTRQDAATREMMALRQEGSGLVLAHEWSQGGEAQAAPVDCGTIQVLWLDGADEAIGAWCAQEHASAIGGSPCSVRLSKLIAVTAGPRHVLLHECLPGDDGGCKALSALEIPLDDLKVGDGHSRFTGTRLWPQA